MRAWRNAHLARNPSRLLLEGTNGGGGTDAAPAGPALRCRIVNLYGDVLRGIHARGGGRGWSWVM